MATEIKVTMSPETYQSLTSLLQMLKFGGTDTRDGEGKQAFMATMIGQGRKFPDETSSFYPDRGAQLGFPDILAIISKQILGDIEGGK